MKTFYLDPAWVAATSLAVALSFASAGNLTAQSTTTDGTSPAVTDNPFSAATAGLPDAGGTAPKQPFVLTKETGAASPNPFMNAVTGASPDTAAKSGAITKTTGTELSSFKMGSPAVVDTQSTKPKGKRQGQPVLVP